jgi:acetyl-CoA C-acetyltransferase
MLPKPVYILSHARTPIGSFLGGLSKLTAQDLGAHAIRAAVMGARIEGSEVEYGIVGQVLTAGCGQAPARQAMLAAGIPDSTDVFSVNKVCSSGMKSIALAAQMISLGESHCVVAAGMESMSNAPHVMRNARLGGQKLGPVTMDDLAVTDGLWDPYNNIHMGTCAEKTVVEFGITREEQDAYAIESYRRANEAWSAGRLVNEIVPVSGVEKDEEVGKLKLEKMAALRPAFDKEGTITAANASKLNDGASAIVLASEEFVKANGLRPIAKILSYADFAQDPIDFSLAPRGAADLAIKRAKIGNTSNVDYWEINEAFSAVPIVNSRLLNIDLGRINVDGGAVAYGHPIGMSGNRIVGTLARILQQRDARIGCAAICNGGGGSSAIVIERM